MRRTTWMTILLVGTLMATTGSTASAAIIQSDANGLAFHGFLTTERQGVHYVPNSGTVIDGNAIDVPNPGFHNGGMWVAGANTGLGTEVDTNLADGVQTYATYTLHFTTEGSYRVFWSGQRTNSIQAMGGGGNADSNDSLWLGGVDVEPTSTVVADWTFFQAGPGSIEYRFTDAVWVIDGSNVNTDLTFTMGMREDGPFYDRVAFVRLDQEGLPVIALADLDANLAVAVPEPSTVAISSLALGLAWLCRRGRRG